MTRIASVSLFVLALAACSPAEDTAAPETDAAAGGETPAAATEDTTALAEVNRPIRIVGSSTVFPFTTAVAESFGARTQFSTPVVESTGTGGGMRLFCQGVGGENPDITGASRRMTASEYEMCQANGVTEIVELPIGYDGIVIANVNTGPELDLTRAQLWRALAAQVPNENCEMIDNPNRSWSDVDPSLPDLRIEVFGPPPTSGTRDAFVELGLEAGAEQVHEETGCEIPEMAMARIREDGAWIDAGENDSAIVQTLANTPSAYGVFGYSFLAQNSDRLKAARVEGEEPTFEAISSGDYPISRSLYVYAKGQHVGVVPGVEAYLAELTSEDAWGEFGYLADRGLIPLHDGERREIADRAASLTAMDGAPE